MKPNRPRSPSSGEAVRVTSRDPRGDARLLGHESATPRTVLDERNAVLRRRFVNLLADGTSGALGAAQRDYYRAQILVQVARAYERIADDLTALEAATDGVQRRDQIMRATVEELMAMAELSTGRASGTSTWAEALVGLRGHIEHLVATGADDAATLIAIDLGVERIEYIEKLADDAMRSYRGYILA